MRHLDTRSITLILSLLLETAIVEIACNYSELREGQPPSQSERVNERDQSSLRGDAR